MSVSKKARYVASITNRTTIFGIMGGLSNSVGVLAANQSAIRNKASNQQVIPLNPVAGLNYMKGNNPMGRIMLSRNPQCSGGVGRTSGGGFAGCSPANNVSASFLAGGGDGSSMMIAFATGGSTDPIIGETQTFGTLLGAPTPPTGTLTPDSSTVVYFSYYPDAGELVIVVNNVNITGGSITISGVTTPSYGPYTNYIVDAVDEPLPSGPIFGGYKGFKWTTPSLPVNLTNGETYRITNSLY